ncbi:UbiX family flavin prenyltransferase [Paracoccus sp. (in: a-proteobacteria)]|uniref:UbiX family flavin prenyltransferase n=1 Tax=Paracoccus sp. TaxID=267 RepID=UPI002AFFF78F|nr:UbiX family flavin prenyltransferase [Paracoccus sp. (in: a-proteobacteria)]
MVHRVVVAFTGASGAAIGMRILERLAARAGVETHTVISPHAERTLRHEVGGDAVERVAHLSSHQHACDNIGATIASGSFCTAGMIVAPCSMRSLAAISAGLSDNLVTRAADVHLKERKPLILLTREAPLHLGHLRNMVSATELGAVIMPPMPAFYHQPQNVYDIIDDIAARAIDLLRLLGPQEARSWKGSPTD